VRYRTKIYLSFLLVTGLSALLGIYFLYTKASSALKLELRTKVVSVAATASALLDPDLVKQVATELNPTSPAFYKLQNELITARDNNRRTDLFIKYIYILRPQDNNPKQMIFVIEAQNAVSPGEIDTQQSQSMIVNHLEEFYSPNRFIHDKWGTWMSGFSPITDREGNYIATLGVDISASSVEATLKTMLQYALLALLTSVSIAYLMAYILAHKMTEALDRVSETLDAVASGDFNVSLHIESQDEFGKLGETINHMILGLKERQALKTSFSKYVSQYVLDQILSEHAALKLQGERKKITVLFSDIRHFTQLSEDLSPESVVAILNEYFEVMLKVIFKYRGTLDKFLGDGLMVEFGAPLEDTEQEIHAVQCGIEMLKELKTLNDRFRSENRPPLDIGVGIHTGYAILGNIGSETRLEYTAIGDTVNVASRLQEATKTFKKPMLVSQETFSALENRFPGTPLGSVHLPGRTKEISIYAIDI